MHNHKILSTDERWQCLIAWCGVLFYRISLFLNFRNPKKTASMVMAMMYKRCKRRPRLYSPLQMERDKATGCESGNIQAKG